MELGLSLPVDAPIAGLAAHAEEVGFDYVASGEHVFFHGPMPSSLVNVAVAAGATTRVKLLTSVVLLPLYPPPLLAKMAVALDVTSGGRLTLGVGVGGEYPPEFEACGVNVDTRGARMDEALPLLDELLRGGMVHHRGRFYRVDGQAIQPPPLSKPRPPIWVAGRKSPALRRTAQYGDGWLPYLCTPDDVARGRAHIARLRDANGRSGGFRTVVTAFLRLEDDAAAARRHTGEYISELYRQDLRFAADKWAIAGDPDSCRDRLAEYSSAGADGIVFVLCARPDEYFDMTTLAATLATAAVSPREGASQ